MPFSSHNSDSTLPPSSVRGEIVPPYAGPGADAAAEQPGVVQRRRVHSAWDPRCSPATYFLVAANVAVFLWMVAHGVSARYPSPNDLLRFGANSAPFVLGAGQWYRLLSATFVHIGLIHLASNMWCLWNLGLLGEPLIGPYGLIAVYMLTGIAGNLLSMAWDVGAAILTRHPLELNVGAGASGAVFGIAGLLIVLLSNRRLPIPWGELKRLRRSVLQFAGLNLLIGGATIFTHILRIDNSAHFGGFLCGLALGFPLVPRMTAGRVRYLARQKITFAGAALLLALFGYWVANL